MSRYKNFLSSLEVSLRSANRSSQEIELIAVSKKKSAIDIQKVIDEGHLSFGENQIQEIERLNQIEKQKEQSEQTGVKKMQTSSFVQS